MDNDAETRSPLVKDFSEGNTKSLSRLTAIILILTAVVALAFRLPFLDRRPMHGDEANQAIKTGQLLETSEYRYDPHDHHGPTLYYLALISAALRGESTLTELSEVSVRLVPVIFGAALILLLWPLRSVLGLGAVLSAGAITAVSPAFVYYSRYYIQETLLVFFTLGLFVSLCRYAQSRALGWAIGAGLFAGLMHATKETAILAWAAMMLAGAATFLWSVPKHQRRELARVNRKHFTAAIVLALAVSVVFYSSFFTHARGPLDSALAYLNFFQRADGAGLHDKPWYYYLRTLFYVHRAPGPWWSEGFILILAFVGIGVAIHGKRIAPEHRRFVRFLALYAVILTLLYSLIPYKTPWVLLSFYHGIILLSGVGIAALWNSFSNPAARTSMAIVFACGTAHLAWQAYQTNFELPADPRNPYVYAHTSMAHLQMVQTIENIAAISPEGRAMQLNVIQPDRDYWPLPWYLRKFTRVGYWDAIPNPPDAPVIIAAPQLYDELLTRLDGKYMTITGGLRPAVFRAVLIRQDIWDAYIKTRR